MKTRTRKLKRPPANRRRKQLPGTALEFIAGTTGHMTLEYVAGFRSVPTDTVSIARVMRRVRAEATK